MGIKQCLSAAEKLQVKRAIEVAEMKTSGEIRVHIESRCGENVLDRAVVVFEKLGMHKTVLRNGVLFYVAFKDHKFAVIGDAGINAVVPGDFWEEIKNVLASNFSQGRLADGLSEGIGLAGEQLKRHFPRAADDTNELTDDVSFGK